ncbi:PVC-type heme-binding CxxCH protein [Niabella hirudinis]|uniref:PVC-type heme-binding CxxCH protein n=1 Tax=Niabella hirudinis TaxID=1285929 RepID=UPI003EB86A51
MKRKFSLLPVACSLCLLVFFSCKNNDGKQGAKSRYAEPLTTEEALKKFELDPNFEIQVFAAEPYITDPVDLAFDENGVAYAVGMPDYPYAPKPGEEKGNIRALLDLNKDGRIDSSIVFADKLSEATSILPWNGGLIVTAAPQILFLKDTNNDYKADIKEVLYTGFYKANSEAQITSLRYSVDNWIYANNRGQAGEVSAPDEPNVSPLNMQGADFRFRPDQKKFEQETGPGQFGQAINDWGHRFFTENSIHIQESVIPWRYTHRIEYLKNPRAIVNISDHDPIMYQRTETPYWRQARTDARNVNFKKQGSKQIEYARDHFTGSSGGTVYDADAFPKEFYGNVFTGDVAGSLVHRDILNLDLQSAVYTAKRAASENDREFLATTDAWFRPVGFTVGPDGYLYVIDYYRQHIETPVSIPDSLKTDMDFMRGSDMGRIYRIVPKGKKAITDYAKLSVMTAAQLLPYLGNGNQWYRLQAQRLIIAKQDKTVTDTLKQIVKTTTNPLERLHAIYTLDGLQALDAAAVKIALADATPGVREHGLVLAERYPELAAEIGKIAVNDPATRVSLQAVLSIGNAKNKPLAKDVLLQVAEKYGGSNAWYKTAILSSTEGSSTGFFKSLIDRKTFFNEFVANKGALVEDYASIIAARNNPAEVATLLKQMDAAALTGNPAWKYAIIKGLGKVYSTGKIKISPATLAQIEKLKASPAKDIADTVAKYVKIKDEKK